MFCHTELSNHLAAHGNSGRESIQTTDTSRVIFIQLSTYGAHPIVEPRVRTLRRRLSVSGLQTRESSLSHGFSPPTYVKLLTFTKRGTSLLRYYGCILKSSPKSWRTVLIFSLNCRSLSKALRATKAAETWRLPHLRASACELLLKATC